MFEFLWDNISSRNFLSTLQGSNVGLVVPMYKDPESEEEALIPGSIAIAVSEYLQRCSPLDSHNYVQFLTSSSQLPVNVFHVAEPCRDSPLREIFVATFAWSDPDKMATELPGRISEIFDSAAKNKVSVLVLPPLGANWQNKNHVGFPVIYDSVLSKLRVNDVPAKIQLSLYSQWPSFELEEAVSSINHVWKANFANEYGAYRGVPVPYRSDLRLLLFFWTCCLFLSSLRTKFTLKKAAVISATFVSYALTIYEKPAQFVSFNSLEGLAFRIFLLLVMTLAFPIITGWDIKNVFERKS